MSLLFFHIFREGKGADEEKGDHTDLNHSEMGEIPPGSVFLFILGKGIGDAYGDEHDQDHSDLKLREESGDQAGNRHGND